ncbi:hypothetical protein NQZ79_g8222 [Umbelopsis isabellina]|nr:hypothetical protein NQZ79_g8222 [Umbelopsis isabellina]
MTANTTNLITTKNPNGFALPGITLESRQVLHELLVDNHEKHHIFFNDKQFHNHIPHQLMAAAALGSSPDTLRKIYQLHSAYQRPQMPVKYDINESNLVDYVLKEDAYSSYLAFFDKQIKSMTVKEIFDKYATIEPIYDGLFGGLYHPLIHFCYGVEFDDKLVMAEGLAMAAVQEQDPGFRVADIFQMENLQLESKSITEILDAIRNDQEIQRAVPYSEPMKFKALGNNDTATKKLLKHTSHWHVAADAQDIDAKFKELFQTVVDLYAASQHHGKPYQLDFFLMHLLTSILFVYVLLPHLSLESQAKVVKVHFVKASQWFVTRGSPKADRSVVYAHKSTAPKTENPWFAVWNMSVENMDLHVVKVIRSLSKADELFAEDGDDYYVKAAQMTVETTIVDDPVQQDVWGRKPVGFDEAWE